VNTPPTPVRFGTFTGVFTPTLLTILGVIMYVRLGWVVGSAGLGGAIAVMGLAMGITICTGLSLASISTNTRLGAGGPYAIISRSLGFEVGGSIGIPLYLSRPFGVAMYVFGFREGWQWFFADHPPLLIDLLVFALLFAIAYRSADLAFKTQYVIMAVIAASLLAIVFSPTTLQPEVAITWWGDYPGFPESPAAGGDFWQVFAVFFPATTGIMAGANMSGDLEDPRRNIPVGALSAIAVSCVIYGALAWWLARSAPMEELASNYMVLVDRTSVGGFSLGWVVVLGLLGATFSSALASMVGGPRILMAMGQHRILPGSEWLAKTTPEGEPRNALVLTGVLTVGALMMRDLNLIAPLITMFFLITYCVVNVVVLLEDSLGLVSFRPTLRVPPVVPLLGAVGCVFAMFIVNPTFGLVAVSTVLAIYAWLQRRGLESEGDVRSSIFGALAEWAAARVARYEGANARAWKPNLLVPVEDPEQLRGEFHFLLDICRPEGSVKLIGLSSPNAIDELRERVARLGRAFGDEDVFCTWSLIDCAGFTTGVAASLQALQSAFFRPNILFLTVPDVATREPEFGELIRHARHSRVGVILLGLHPRAGLGQARLVHLWLRPHGDDWDTEQAFTSANLNLTLLMGYRLLRTWGAELELLTAVVDESAQAGAQAFLDEVCDLARLPTRTGRRVMVVESFEEAVIQAPVADINILGLQPDPDFEFCQKMVTLSRASCMFVTDSGSESALV